MQLKEITFDDDDKNLFLIDDLELKADAIRYSILPKLDVIVNELIFRIGEMYSLNFFENYSTAKSPHFRLSKTQRKEPTKTDYIEASISITGQRKDFKWKGLNKGDEKIPKISPTSLSISLNNDGMVIVFFFNHPKNFTEDTYKKFYQFFINEVNILTGLMSRADLKYDFLAVDTFTIMEDIDLRLSTGNYDLMLYSKNWEYPINYEKINQVCYSCMIIFPILNGCIEIALGNEPNISSDIELLERGIVKYLENYFENEKEEEVKPPLGIEELMDLKQKIENKIKVMPGIRWQVFKRDNWRCVSCGRSAADNVMMHVDHVLPRSLGGKDVIENYQTLCETCNIGKSNKDTTNLRRR